MQLLRRLWQHISPRRRGQFGFLLVLMILASFAEILSIGAVLPFLGVLTAPSSIFEHPIAQPFIQTIGLTSADQLLLPLTIFFGFAALMAGSMRLLPRPLELGTSAFEEVPAIAALGQHASFLRGRR